MIELFLKKENEILLAFFEGDFDACLAIIGDLEKNVACLYGLSV